jgi:GAF domain-containing protein
MNERDRVASVFVELADTLADGFDPTAFLSLLAKRYVELLPVVAAGVMIVDPGGTATHSASDPVASRLLTQYGPQNSQGPVYECLQQGEAVINAAPAPRWQEFDRACREAGYVSAHVLPLRLRDELIGAVGLFCASPKISDTDAVLAQALADVATIALLQQRSIQQMRVVADQLQAALNSRVILEQAKGIIAERSSISPGQAFNLMRDHARANRESLSRLATDVVEGTSRLRAPIDAESGP